MGMSANNRALLKAHWALTPGGGAPEITALASVLVDDIYLPPMGLSAHPTPIDTYFELLNLCIDFTDPGNAILQILDADAGPGQ
jgi:hypothetical protein